MMTLAEVNLLSNLQLLNPLTPIKDQDRISPYNIITNNICKHKSDENKDKYQLGDFKLIQYQILRANITRTV